MPFWVRALGGRVEEVPVAHSPWTAGSTKCGLLDRALAGLVDCLGVRWMSRRLARPAR